MKESSKPPFTSESTREALPHAVRDQVADTIRNDRTENEPNTRVALNLATTGLAEAPKCRRSDDVHCAGGVQVLGKGENYYVADRSDFLSWIGGEHRRVLDVGCATGHNAQWLREHGAEHLVGVEIDAESARRAALTYDVVHQQPIEEALDVLHGPFDLIICADVLEHLVDPWSVVSRLLSLSSDAGIIALSIPNIRYFRALLRIAFGRGFEYESDGLFDFTHLRFFTRQNVAHLLQQRGWRIKRCRGRMRGRRAQQLSKLAVGGLDEWLTYQWYVVAVPDEAAA